MKYINYFLIMFVILISSGCEEDAASPTEDTVDDILDEQNNNLVECLTDADMIESEDGIFPQLSFGSGCGSSDDMMSEYEAILDLDSDNENAHLALAFLNLVEIYDGGDLTSSLETWLEGMGDLIDSKGLLDDEEDDMERSASGQYITNEDIVNHFGDFVRFLPVGIVASGNFDSDSAPELVEIQEMMENHILPKLDIAIGHIDNVTGNDFEFDMGKYLGEDEGEIVFDDTVFYLLSSGLHLLRTAVNAIVAYDMNIPYGDMDFLDLLDEDGDVSNGTDFSTSVDLNNLINLLNQDESNTFLTLRNTEALPEILVDLKAIVQNLEDLADFNEDLAEEFSEGLAHEGECLCDTTMDCEYYSDHGFDSYDECEMNQEDDCSCDDDSDDNYDEEDTDPEEDLDFSELFEVLDEFLSDEGISIEMCDEEDDENSDECDTVVELSVANFLNNPPQDLKSIFFDYTLTIAPQTIYTEAMQFATWCYYDDADYKDHDEDCDNDLTGYFGDDIASFDDLFNKIDMPNGDDLDQSEMTLLDDVAVTYSEAGIGDTFTENGEGSDEDLHDLEIAFNLTNPRQWCDYEWISTNIGSEGIGILGNLFGFNGQMAVFSDCNEYYLGYDENWEQIEECPDSAKDCEDSAYTDIADAIKDYLVNNLSTDYVFVDEIDIEIYWDYDYNIDCNDATQECLFSDVRLDRSISLEFMLAPSDEYITMPLPSIECVDTDSDDMVDIDEWIGSFDLTFGGLFSGITTEMLFGDDYNEDDSLAGVLFGLLCNGVLPD